MATPLKPIECSAQPLCLSFHPAKDIVAAGLVDGTVEVHDYEIFRGGSDDAAASTPGGTGGDDEGMEDDSDGEADTILSSIHVAREVSPSKSGTLTFLSSSRRSPQNNHNNSRHSNSITYKSRDRVVCLSL